MIEMHKVIIIQNKSHDLKKTLKLQDKDYM